MKIRSGFVSNSSSSSFIITIKNGKELSKKTLLEVFEVTKTSPLYGFANELADWIIQNVKKQSIKDIHDNYVGSYNKPLLTEDEMIEEIVKEYYGDDEKREELEKIKNNEIFYYEGSASDDSGDGIENYLCETGINVDNSNITIKSGGSY